MKVFNSFLFAGIYFDVMEIQPLVQGIFHFDSADQKVNINYSTDKYDWFKQMNIPYLEIITRSNMNRLIW